MPGDALMRYTPSPCQTIAPYPAGTLEEMVLNGSVLSTVKNGGPRGLECKYNMAPFRRSFPQYFSRFGT